MRVVVRTYYDVCRLEDIKDRYRYYKYRKGWMFIREVNIVYDIYGLGTER